jgi:iron(III) transport system substrate-binding protein
VTRPRRSSAGECDLGIGNTYYVGLMMTNEKEPEQKDWATPSRCCSRRRERRHPRQHLGRGDGQNAPNKDNAVKLIQFLSATRRRRSMPSRCLNIRSSRALEPSDDVKSFGELKPDTLPLADIAKNRKAASEMVDRVGLDDGPSS